MPAQAEMYDALKEVIDPELMVNIVDLGLVYALEQTDRHVGVDMTLTSPACPAGPELVGKVKAAIEGFDDVDEASVKLVMDPPWTPERMTEDAKDQLGIF
ncbi:MAG: metal-sulfur cluster assembly factor [Planctomycetota bacterium]